MGSEFDVIVIGAGHNGLVCATYLARAGLNVLVLERRERSGGACTTEEIYPGFKVSTGAYVTGLLRPEIVEDLNLKKFGLRQVPFEPQSFHPFPDGKHLFLWSDIERTCKEIERFSKKDAKSYRNFDAYWTEFFDMVEPAMLAPPAPLRELAALMEGPEAEDFLRKILFYSAAELLDEYFESDYVKAALCNQSIIGIYGGPRTPGTAFNLGHNILGNIDGVRGAWGIAIGGMGAIIDALVASARASGVQIETRCEVERVLVQRQKAVGVELATKERIRSDVVVSNADPKRTFLSLVEPHNLPEDFVKAIRNFRTEGAAMKVHCALKQLPDFSAAPSTGVGPQHTCSTYICPTIDYAERAWDDAKYGRPSREPWMEVVCQSAIDPSVAPAGRHTISFYVQYTPYTLRDGNWDDLRDEMIERVTGTFAQYAPNLPASIIATHAYTPLDFERNFGLTGGHQSHGDMSADQFFSFRPVPGYSNYRTPVKGLYLCGAGTHPGGGVIGAPGYNAANAILEDLRSASTSPRKG